jgi:putative ABC transport system permease protein
MGNVHMLPLAYNLRNLQVRRLGTAATVLGVALVVSVFCYLLCLADGLGRALTLAGDAHNLVVLAEHATAESNSAVFHDDVQRLASVPDVARGEAGRPLVSAEYVVHTDVPRRGDPLAAPAGILVRGVNLEIAARVRPAVRLVEGRWFTPGSAELVVGRAAQQQFAGLEIGSRLSCGDREFQVVGVFSATGSAHESELWGHASNVADAFRRTSYSAAVLRLRSADGAVVAAARGRIGSACVGLRAVPEREYYGGQAQSAGLLRRSALLLVALMSVAAVLAATNTMLSSVAGRTRELGMLRAVGFSPRAVCAGIVLESLAVALLGGVLGCLACAAVITLAGRTYDFVGTLSTYTSVAFTIRVSLANVLASLGVAAVVGVLGGLWPARAAVRVPVVHALRAT